MGAKRHGGVQAAVGVKVEGNGCHRTYRKHMRREREKERLLNNNAHYWSRDRLIQKFLTSLSGMADQELQEGRMRRGGGTGKRRRNKKKRRTAAN